MPYRRFLAWQDRSDDAGREAPLRRYLGAASSSLALHLAIVAAMMIAPATMPWASSAATAANTPAAEPKPDPIVTLVPPLEDPSSAGAGASTRKAPPIAPEFVPPDLGIQLDDDAAMLRLRDFTFDVKKLTSRAAALFPFLTSSPSFEPPPASRPRAREPLVNPFARARAEAERPLTLSDDALQALIDKAWSRRERWEPFQPIAALARQYSPDEGRVPDLLRGYVAQNGLQIYVDPGIRDPRLWVQLGLVADHASFLDYISRFAERHPSTKATTELLFLVDKLAQGSLDGLVTLLDIDPIRDLRWTRDVNREAYDALVVIRRHYEREVQRRGLQSREQLELFFDARRLSVLDTIVRTTPHGYRANDARFLMGEVYWRHQRRADALKLWRTMCADAAGGAQGSAAAVADLCAELRDRRHPSEPDLREVPDKLLESWRVDRILEAERSRWVGLSYDRLNQFGYRFDTF